MRIGYIVIAELLAVLLIVTLGLHRMGAGAMAASIGAIGFIGVVGYALATRTRALRNWRRQHNHCVHCGYDLRAAVAERCPECGRSVTEGILRS